MPNRRVAVELTLETAQYQAEARVVERTTAAVDREMGELDRAVDAVDRDMGELAVTSRVAARQVDNLGDQARGAAGDFALLNHEISASKTRIHELYLQFANTRNESLFGDIRKEEANLRRLERAAKALLPDIRKGLLNSDLFSGDFSKMVGESRGIIIVGAVGLLAALSPLIGSVIAGAVVGAVGAGGIVGGIASASHDSRVQAAATEFGETFKNQFFGGGEFIGPIVNSLHELDAAVVDMQLGQKFAFAAPFVEDVAKGLADMARNFASGFGGALKNAGPFFEILADDLPLIGDALGDMVYDLARNEGALMGWQVLLKAVEETIRVVGDSLVWLGDRFASWERFQVKAADVAAKVAHYVPLLNNFKIGDVKLVPGRSVEEQMLEARDRAQGVIDSIERAKSEAAAAAEPSGHDFWATLTGASADAAVKAIESVGDAATRTAKELDTLHNAAENLIPAYFKLEDTQDTTAAAVPRLAKQVKDQRDNWVDGAGALTGNTQAARDNREAVRDLVAMYGDLMIQTTEAGGSTDTLKQQLTDTLVQMGFNRAEVKRYVDQLDRIPTELITSLKVENKQALEAIQETDREMRRLPALPSPPVNIPTFREDERASPPPYYTPEPNPGEGRRESGGWMDPYGTYTVGEAGFERVKMMGPLGAYVFPNTTSGGSTSLPEVHVYIGDQELRGMVRVELRENNRDVTRRVQAGSTR